jgi:chemotaxis protein MotA
MLAIVGSIIVMGCVLGGYILHGGKIGVLIVPTEYLIIFGAALGSLVTAAPMTVIKGLVHELLGILKKKEPTPAEFTELLLLIFEVTKQAKQNLLGLEAHVEKPENSDIFKKYPGVLANHHAIDFICDTMKVQISSPVSAYDLDDLMEADLEAIHSEEAKIPAQLTIVSDAMPGLGIVAAVLGVVITMGKLTQGKEVIGQSVAGALVGTFIGILASYGFLGPLAKKIEANQAQEGKYMQVIKAGLLAFAKGCSPKVCVEFSRRSIPAHLRPSFEDIDKATANLKAA